MRHVFSTSLTEETLALRGHALSVTSVAFSRDGSIVASGSHDSTVRTFDARTGQALCVMEEHTHGVLTVAFSPVALIIASGSRDTTVRLWNADSGALLKTLEEHTSYVNQVAFSRDGNILASCSHDQTVRTWNATTGEALIVFKGHTETVYSVAFSSDDGMLASASCDSTVRLWDFHTGEALKVLNSYTNMLPFVAFCPNSPTLATSSTDGRVLLWNVDTGEVIQELSLWEGQVESMDWAFSPDGSIFAALVGCMLARSIGPGKTPKSVKNDKFMFAFYPSALAFSPDGTVLALGGTEHNVYLWDATKLIPASDKMVALLMASLPRNAHSPPHVFLLHDGTRDLCKLIFSFLQ